MLATVKSTVMDVGGRSLCYDGCDGAIFFGSVPTARQLACVLEAMWDTGRPAWGSVWDTGCPAWGAVWDTDCPAWDFLKGGFQG